MPSSIRFGGISLSNLLFQVQLKKVTDDPELQLPSKMSQSASGFDLHAALTESVTMHPGERHLIPTGISIAMPENLEAQIRPRSGLALKHGVTVLNSPGTIDADYRGEIKVILINLGNSSFTIHKNERIAQMIFQEVAQVTLTLVHELDETSRGAGGFGHTGI
jgi:dUTP pyrophosphatase